MKYFQAFKYLAVIAAVAGLALATAGSAWSQSKEIRMIEAGGKSGESIQKGYIDPLKAKTGINVIRENPSTLGKLRSMVEANSVTAALLELDSAGVEQAKALDLVEPLDWAMIDPMPIFDEARQDVAYGYQYYSTIMAWRSDAKAPKNWQDFWNVADFPGKRALPDYPTFALPVAALADGVPPDQLYPLDLDRAFASLEKIKDHVAVWWQAGAQPPQLLKDNEVQYAVAWSGRVAGQEGIDYTFNQGMIDLAWFVVPKGTKPEDKAAAMKLLHEMSIPENQAIAAEVVSYTGNSPDLEPLLPKDRLKEYPTTTENKAGQVLTDAKWWFEHAEEVETRWQEFKLGL